MSLMVCKLASRLTMIETICDKMSSPTVQDHPNADARMPTGNLDA